MRIEELDQPEDWKKTFAYFANDPKGFMILAGTNGTGKTTTAEAIYQQARIRNHNPQEEAKLFFTQTDLFMKWNADRQQWGAPDYLYGRLATARLLVLDDLGTRTPSAAFTDFLYAIIEKRERNKVKYGTIITTNLTGKKMREQFGDAIVSRIASGKVFRYEGKDRRYTEF